MISILKHVRRNPPRYKFSLALLTSLFSNIKNLIYNSEQNQDNNTTGTCPETSTSFVLFVQSSFGAEIAGGTSQYIWAWQEGGKQEGGKQEGGKQEGGKQEGGKQEGCTIYIYMFK